MAGAVVTTEEVESRPSTRAIGVRKVAFAWTSSAGGAADATTTDVYSGAIERLVTVPGSAGAAPTDNYDVAVRDEDGTDVLMGAGADRDTANTEQVLGTSLGIVANDKLTLAVANAGATKSGVVYLYIR